MLFPFHRKIETEEIRFSFSSQRTLLAGLLLTFPGFFLVRPYSPEGQGLSQSTLIKLKAVTELMHHLLQWNVTFAFFDRTPSLPGSSDGRYRPSSKKNAQVHPQNTAVNSMALWASQGP